MPTQPTFEEPPVSATLIQAGSYNGSTWTEGTVTSAGAINPNISWSDTQNIGYTFDFGISTESERGLNLAPLIPYTDVNSDLAGTSETDRPWGFVIAMATTRRTFTLYVENNPAPELFSTSNPPVASGTPSPLLYQTYTNTDLVWTVFGSNYNLEIPIDFSTTNTTVAGTSVSNGINKLVRDPLWNGRIQFFLVLGESVTISTVASGTFLGRVVPFHTGQMGLDIHRRARVVHDYINGYPYLSDEAVEDPWREGVMVHAASADPVEPRRHHSYIPPISEGVVDDDIPDVE